MNPTPVIIRQLGLCDYLSTWEAMKTFTQKRDTNTPDEIWLLEHPSVFTQGSAGKPEHLLNPGNIPVIQTDRGGQVTYHGPGQLIIYLLIDLKRKNIGIKTFITTIEQIILELLKKYNVTAKTNLNTRGVYVNDAKICSIGCRISRGCSYHGLSLNVNMDLEPFSRINPCGFHNLPVTQLSELKQIKNMKHIFDHINLLLRQYFAFETYG